MGKFRVRQRVKRICYKLLLERDIYMIYKNSLPRSLNNSLNYLILETRKKNVNNYYLNKEIISKSMKLKKWELAVNYWPKVIYGKKRPSIDSYLSYIHALKSSGKNDTTVHVLQEAILRFPKNNKLKIKLFEQLILSKKWDEAIDLWEQELYYIAKKDKRILVSIIKAYKKRGIYGRAEQIIKDGLKDNYDSIMLMEYVDIAIRQKKWELALYRIKVYFKDDQTNSSFEIKIIEIMLMKILGKEESKDFYNNYKNHIKDSKRNYRRITIFNNGETKIDYYKKLNHNNSVIITFDSANMIWKNPPFAFKLLIRQNVDIIAVRKRRAKAKHQDLSREEFYNVVNKLVTTYKETLAYGYSLGGYTSLYYGSMLECNILSLAPRLSMHPVFGKEGKMDPINFKHIQHIPCNKNINPVIVFDPKQRLDNTYVQEGLINSFPNAHLIKIPYGGHGIAPHLLRTGQLKKFILTLINENEIPVYDSTKKRESNIYLRVLAQACYNRNKINWARQLVESSLKLKADDLYAIRLKIKILKKQENYKEALDYTSGVIKLMPKEKTLKRALTELKNYNQT